MTNGLLTSETGELPAKAGEDDVRQYLQEIRRFPVLSPERERELARLCAQGDQEAVRTMVNSNLRLVVSVAREYAGRGAALMDLVQEGSIGLLAAARKFDYTLEFRFSTYATKWIRQGITRYLINHGSMIRVPAHTAERVRKVQLARAEYLQNAGTEPTPAQLAAITEIPEKKVTQYLQMTGEICSLDAPLGTDADGTLAVLLEDLQAPQPQEELVRRELKKTMDALLSYLSERQRQVLRLHFGMTDGVCHSLESIGVELGISKERVRQIERQAMDRLQKLGTGMGLEDFLNE